MSFSSNGVKFKNTQWIRNRIFKLLFRGAEGILSVLFVITLAAPMVFPNNVNATAGVSNYLSYQGRLTNANGDPYTGTYCLKFSFYDAPSAGTKLWPAGAPIATTTVVTNGVFSAPIGDTADTLNSYDFSANDTEYLNIDVYSVAGSSCTGGSWETLAPRQRMDATPYARVAANVWGSLLKTDITNNRVQVGLGSGGSSPVWTRFDNKNTASTIGSACPSGSVMGDMWYNSSGTRALFCGAGSLIVGIDNTNEITNLNITGNTAGTPAAISTGAVSFAGGNNITLSQAGNAITISGQPAHGVVITSGIGGGTAGVTASISSGYMTLAGGNNITLSQNGNAITISAGAGGGGVAISAAGSSQNAGTIVFSNANNVSFGMNGSTITATVTVAGGGGGGVT
ncbi:MAG: hypothetical protein HZB12_02035, partial [Candidatus Yonathbacteria bacterium]|nr:hypothetical protein [Candidatus Yonathbacteria bacterium]